MVQKQTTKTIDYENSTNNFIGSIFTWTGLDYRSLYCTKNQKQMKTTIALILFTTLLNAQEKITIGAFQDIKLGLGMDEEHGNPDPTLDLILNFSLEGKQFKYYYFSVVPFFEIANLKEENYKRYGVSLMWNFNKLYLDKLEIGIGAGFGIIHRPDSYASYSLTADLSYPILKNISVALKNEWVRRTELETPKTGYNLSLGIKVNLIRL